MLKNADIELIEYLKKTEYITIDMINDVREAYFLKLQENHIKSVILDWLPQTKYIEKLINNIYDERDYWQTVVGYWIFKKLKEEFPDLSIDLSDEEPKAIDYVIVEKMQATILEGESKIVDVISLNGDIGIVKETNRIINTTGNLGLKDIEYLYITEGAYRDINKLLNDINENQRLKRNVTKSFSTIIGVEYNNPTGAKIYSNCMPTRYHSFKCEVMSSLWVINGKDPVRLFEFKDNYVRENKDFDSILNNEKKRAKEAIKRERVNKKFQVNKK